VAQQSLTGRRVFYWFQCWNSLCEFLKANNLLWPG
jgi:hypothetical protein